MSPKGEQAPSYGGVLTKPAATVIATLLAVGAVLTAGWKLRDFVTQASAAEMTPSVVAEMRADIASIKSDTGSMKVDVGNLKTDMLKVKCRFNIEGTCSDQPQLPVHVSGIGH